MAVAIAHIAVPDMNSVWFDGRMLFVLGTLTIDANPATYVTGGIACSFSHPLVKAQRVPKVIWFNSPSGSIYTYIPGTNVSNGLLKIFTGVNTELGNGVAIPAVNSGETVQFEGQWLGQN